jgi:transposase
LRAAEQDRPDVAQAREAWKANQANLNPDKLAFIDETGASTKMVRQRGRCRRGERLLAKAPFGHWKTTTFTAGLRRNGLVAPFVLDGPMNGEAFRVYVEKILVPSLVPDDIVVKDNLPAHKVEGVRKLIADAGAELRLLPAYSPDLNPIEMAFAQLKSHLRKAAERTAPALWNRIGQCLDEITPQACANYFAEAGYAPSWAGSALAPPPTLLQRRDRLARRDRCG